MSEERVADVNETRAKLPMWLQCIVAVIGAVVIVGPAAAVVWYR